MNFVNKDIIKYGLHDTAFDFIEINSDGITLLFADGVYFLDENGKEVSLSKECRLKLTIDNFNSENLSEHITVTKVHKNKVQEIEMIDFINKLKNNRFDIYLDFYSDFSRSILLKGYLSKNKFEIIMSEINNIEFII